MASRRAEKTTGDFRRPFDEALDVAVAAAYSWCDYMPAMPDDEILRRLLVLNLERAGVKAVH